MHSVQFAYHDGRKQRSIDPLEVVQSLSSCPVYRPALIDDAIGGDTFAVNTLSEIARHVFRVRHLTTTGDGLTRLECVLLLHRFDRWLAKLKSTSAI